jgi:hypothetical protein
MRMISEAIEDAASASEFFRRITSVPGTTVHIEAGNAARQPGQNRTEHRARLKRERRMVKSVKVAP